MSPVRLVVSVPLLPSSSSVRPSVPSSIPSSPSVLCPSSPSVPSSSSVLCPSLSSLSLSLFIYIYVYIYIYIYQPELLCYCLIKSPVDSIYVCVKSNLKTILNWRPWEVPGGFLGAILELFQSSGSHSATKLKYKFQR